MHHSGQNQDQWIRHLPLIYGGERKLIQSTILFCFAQNRLTEASGSCDLMIRFRTHRSNRPDALRSRLAPTNLSDQGDFKLDLAHVLIQAEYIHGWASLHAQ